VERFNPKKLNDVAHKEECQVQISNTSATLKNLKDDNRRHHHHHHHHHHLDMNRPLESIGENIKL